MATPVPLDPAELLAHAGWMRALAASLVRDSASADDVVQESLAAALRRGPERNRPVEAWLARVVRNVASNFRRAEAREAERRPHGASPQLPDPAETIERLDTQRRIVELVRALDEPSRSTIVLRHFEGLTSEQIGARMGVSDATVRWRLAKALDELRARLQKDYGSREAWCAVLAPLAKPFAWGGTTAAIGGATTGALAMGTVFKFAIAAASLAIFGAGAWYALERSPVQPDSTAAAAPATAGLLEAPAADAGAPDVLASPAPAAIADGAASRVPAESTGPTGAVRARFVDPAGHPRAGVELRLASTNFGCVVYLGQMSTLSGADGRAQLSVDLRARSIDTNYELLAYADGCGTFATHATLVPAGVVDLGDVVLFREARLLGRVRAADGSGVEDVEIGLTKPPADPRGTAEMRRSGPMNPEHLFVTRSDETGAFELEAVSPGEFILWGHRTDGGWGISEPFSVQPGEVRKGLDFEVPALLATDTITGVVLDPEGKPAAKAQVSFRWKEGFGSGSTSCFARDDGSFELLLNCEVAGDLTAKDEERRLTSAPLPKVAPGARGVELRLAGLGAPRVAHLWVRGPEGEPVSGVHLTVLERQGETSYFGKLVTPRELEPGKYEFQASTVEFKLKVQAPGYIDGELKDLDPASLPNLELALERTPLLSGRVTAAGRAVPSAKIEALHAVAAGRSVSVNEFPSLVVLPFVDPFTGAPDGTFTIELQREEPVYLRCVAEGYAPAFVGPFDPDSWGKPVEIVLDSGGTLAGRARAKDGTPVVGAIVGITCGDGHPLTLRSGLDGAFRFEHLAAGSWLVVEAEEELGRGTRCNTDNVERAIEWSCTVKSGETTYFDLTLNR